jgi:MFS family permease
MGMGSLTEGYTAAVIGPTLAQPSFIKYFDLATRPNATGIISSMNGVFFAGAAILVFTIPSIADRYGRKMAIVISAIVVIITSALLAGSTNVGEFITFRFFSGAGTWMMLAAVPIWMTEVVPPRIRGTLVDIHGACLLFGYAVASWTGYGFYYVDSIDAWRGPFGECSYNLVKYLNF